MAKQYTPEQIADIENKVKNCKKAFETPINNLKALLIQFGEYDQTKAIAAIKPIKDVLSSDGPLFDVLINLNVPTPQQVQAMKVKNSANAKQILKD
jgi:hypothetical protein